MEKIYIICIYLGLLVVLGIVSARFFRGTSSDYFVASHSIGPVLLLMSVFGTTMTAFAMVGSTAESYRVGVATYGKIAAISGLVHSFCFFFVGLRLWALGKRYGYRTQIEFFRDRFESPLLSYLLFPILVGLVIPYLLAGLLGAGALMSGVTRGMFPETFAGTNGAVPTWLTGLVICGVVLSYIGAGGVRSAAWANTFQTIVFMIMAGLAFFVIADKLGGLETASMMSDEGKRVREGNLTMAEFWSYSLIPLSVAMFPHLFQHWLTARSANAFKLTLVAHPICILITWIPCILIGLWATGAMLDGALIVPEDTQPNAVLGIMINKLLGPIIGGLVTAGVLAAIMSSLDSQFVCLGTIFTRDFASRFMGKRQLTERQTLWLARGFVVAIVALVYALSLAEPRQVFALGIWCFSGFSSLFPLVIAALYWKRATKAGAIVSILVTAGAWLYMFYQSDFGDIRTYRVFGMMPVALLVAINALTMFIVSMGTRRPSPETMAKFFRV